MTKVAFLGDVHGRFEAMQQVLTERLDERAIIQVGDFGYGFRFYPYPWPDGLYTIPGNHDNPEVAVAHPHCLGYYGHHLIDSLSMPLDVFVVGGGRSVDWKYRTPGVDWWSNEELNVAQSYEALDLYKKAMPEVLVTHEPPQFVYSKLGWEGSHTAQLIQAMLELHKPRLLVCGHLHIAKKFQFGRCKVRVLSELELWQTEI